MEEEKIMKKLLLLLSLLLFVSCQSGKPMDVDLYNQVTIGMTKADLKSLCGSPIEIKNIQDEEEYIYVERITMGSCRVAENYYSFFLKDNVVTHKSIRTQKPPQFNLIYTEDPNNPCM